MAIFWTHNASAVSGHFVVFAIYKIIDAPFDDYRQFVKVVRMKIGILEIYPHKRQVGMFPTRDLFVRRTFWEGVAFFG